MTKAELQALIANRDRIMTKLIEESDPENWPAADSVQGRGDRLYMKKNAIASAQLLAQLERIINDEPEEPSAERDAEILAEAKQLEEEALSKLAKAPKRNFTRSTDGSAEG